MLRGAFDGNISAEIYLGDLSGSFSQRIVKTSSRCLS
jgi:hypothetical protein